MSVKSEWVQQMSSIQSDILYTFAESRSSCGCGSGGSGLTLPLLLGALFLATAFLNNQIMNAGGGRKRRKRQIENMFKSILNQSTNRISRKNF